MDPRPDRDGPSHIDVARRRFRRSAATRAGLAACLVAVGAGGAVLWLGGPTRRTAPAKPVPLGTATVHRGALISTQRYHGHLRYPSRGHVHFIGTGIVTSLPRVGRVLAAGGAAGAVDDQPIGVLYGTAPLYRPLGSSRSGAQLAVQSARANLLAAEAELTKAQAPARGAGTADAAATSSRLAATAQARVGVAEAEQRLAGAERSLRRLAAAHGPDVALISANMMALGYGTDLGDRWDAALQRAVARWQQHLGATSNGRISPDDVIVIRGASRVNGVVGQIGDAPSAITLQLTASTRLATFTLKDGVPAGLKTGRRVRLTAAGSTTPGAVASVTTDSRATTIQVSLPPRSAVARSGDTRVTMTVSTLRSRDALLVSTQSLLALASGGYALQLPGGRLLAVRTGTMQGGDIQVSGPGVHAGLRVVSVT